MYINSSDYKSVWALAFSLTGMNEAEQYDENITDEVKLNIQRLTSSIMRNQLNARGRYLQILGDDSIFTFIFQLPHFVRLFKTAHGKQIDKKYLSQIYIKRSDLLLWCEREYLEPPIDWRVKPANPVHYDASDDGNDSWYNELTERRKKRVACLELAKQIWTEYPDKSYEQVYRDPIMKKYGNPNVFSFDTFKKWARPFAPESAKQGGRPPERK